MTRFPSALEARLPVPVLTGLLLAACYAHAHLTGIADDAPLLRIDIATAVALASLLVATLALATFRRAHTTIDPMHPQRAAVLVTHGIYRLSRNPMYLSLGLLLASYPLRMGSWAEAATLPLFVAYVTRFQIVPEERALEARFGEAFRAYCARTRRWL